MVWEVPVSRFKYTFQSVASSCCAHSFAVTLSIGVQKGQSEPHYKTWQWQGQGRNVAGSTLVTLSLRRGHGMVKPLVKEEKVHCYSSIFIWAIKAQLFILFRYGSICLD